MPLEPLDEPACLSGGEGFIEGSRFMGVQVVLHEDDLGGFGKVRI